MRGRTKLYLLFIGLIGSAAVLYSAWACFFSPERAVRNTQLPIFLFLLFLCWLCSCLPVYIRDDCTVDLSFLGILAAVLLVGPEGAVLISAVSFPFVVVSAPDGSRHEHILNTAPIKTFFNIGDHALSYALGGLAFHLAGGVAGNMALPGVLLQMAAFLFVAMAANAFLMLFFFMLEHDVKFYPTIFQMFLSLLPSVVCCAPIGYFLALLLHSPSGIWMSLLFMLPLLLARYSFKLFLAAQQQQQNLLRAFATALDAKDTYTQGHSKRVSLYAERIATEMGLSPHRIERLRLGAAFHDLGKIGIPDSILQKPSTLTFEEREVIQGHPVTGVNILKDIVSYKDLLPYVRHHHERYDGKGYPDHIGGDDIPLEIYILGAADAYDAITSERPYCKGRTPQMAGRILWEEAGKQFHPAVARVAAGLAESGELERCIPSTEMEATAC